MPSNKPKKFTIGDFCNTVILAFIYYVVAQCFEYNESAKWGTRFFPYIALGFLVVEIFIHRWRERINKA